MVLSRDEQASPDCVVSILVLPFHRQREFGVRAVSHEKRFARYEPRRGDHRRLRTYADGRG